MNAMTRLLLVTLAAASVLLGTHVHRYAGLNAGVYIDLPAGHWCGIEYRGTPGGFCDAD